MPLRSLLPLVLFAVLLPVRAARGECAERVSVLSLEATVGAAEQAYQSLDGEAFDRHAGELDAVLQCVARWVPRPTVARIHRVYALRAYAAGDEAAAVAAFAAARAADPSVSLTGLIPEGHDMHQLFGQQDTDGPVTELPAPANGALYLDGVRSRQRPGDRPVIAQWGPEAGLVNLTAWVSPENDVPAYPVSAPSAAVTEEISRRRGTGWLVAGSATAVAAGALLAGAIGSRADFFADHPDWDRTDLDRVQRRTNRLVGASAVAGGAALGLLGTGVVVRW